MHPADARRHDLLRRRDDEGLPVGQADAMVDVGSAIDRPFERRVEADRRAGRIGAQARRLGAQAECGTGPGLQSAPGERDLDRLPRQDDPRAIIDTLNLLRPIYRSTTNYGHFGRPGLPWETTVKVAAATR